jgi:hypothetical protein
MTKRSIFEIQIAVQEANEDISNEELRLCIEAQRNIEHFYKKELLGLIDAIKADKPVLFLRIKAKLAEDFCKRMFDAGKKPPDEWLGPDNIPGTPAQQERLAWAKRVFKKATGETL